MDNGRSFNTWEFGEILDSTCAFGRKCLSRLIDVIVALACCAVIVWIIITVARVISKH